MPKSSPPGSAEEIELGYISGIFGVRGEVRVFLHNQGSDLLVRERNVVLVSPEGVRRPARMSTRPGAGKRILGRIADVSDRDVAASLKGWQIWFPVSELPRPDHGEFYVWQIEGARLELNGAEIGEVVTVHPTDGDDVLEVVINGEPEFLPLLHELFEEIDVDGGRVVLSPMAAELLESA